VAHEFELQPAEPQAQAQPEVEGHLSEQRDAEDSDAGGDAASPLLDTFKAHAASAHGRGDATMAEFYRELQARHAYR